MTRRFNPAPGWPAPPPGWTPPPGWKPDPAWPAAPDGWQFWVGDATEDDDSATAAPSPEAGPPGPPGPQTPASPGAPDASGWAAPAGAGEGFAAWVRGHKLIAGAAGVFIAVMLSWWVFGDRNEPGSDTGSVTAPGGGFPAGNGSDSAAPGLPEDPNDRLVASIDAALDAVAAQSPTGSASPPATSALPTGTDTPVGSPSGGTSSPTPTVTTQAGGRVQVTGGATSLPVTVIWTLDPELSGARATDVTYRGLVAILRTIRESGYPYGDKAVIVGSYRGQNDVISATFPKTTVDTLDFGADPRTIVGAAVEPQPVKAPLR